MSARTVIKMAAISLPACLLSILAVTGCVEAWTRLHWNPFNGTPGFFLSDPVRIQRLAPGYSGWFAGVPVKINGLGLRDNREYDLRKGAKTFRILVLGDSVTFGHGSVYEHTYPYLLERRLRAWRRDVDWQVWNAAVPGYNTSQELAHLLEVGPEFQPDLVIVGFFENDVIDNFPVGAPGPAARARSAVLSWLYRHVYSTELYKRIYLQVLWRMTSSNAYRLRLEHLGEEEQLTATVQNVRELKYQDLTPFERFTDDEVASIRCDAGTGVPSGVVPAMAHERGFGDWLEAVRRIRSLDHESRYRIVFFVNLAPLACPDRDVFYDGGSAALNRFFMGVLGDGTAAVSTYDAFRHTRPSQMPIASGHAVGNSNAVKADVLFNYLREQVFPGMADDRVAAILRLPPTN